MADLRDAIEGNTAALRKSIDEVAPVGEGGPPGPDELLAAFESYRSRAGQYRKQREDIHAALCAALNGKDGAALRMVEFKLDGLRHSERVTAEARDQFVLVLSRLLAPLMVGPAEAFDAAAIAKVFEATAAADPPRALEGTAGSVPPWRCAACGIGRQAIDSGKPCPACGGTVLRDADGKVPMFVAVGAEVHDATPPAPDTWADPEIQRLAAVRYPPAQPGDREMPGAEVAALLGKPIMAPRTAGPAGVAAGILADVADDFRARRQLAAPIMSINVACPRCRVTPIPAEPGRAIQCGSCREWFVLCSHCRDQRIKMPGAPTLPAQGHCLCGAIFDLI